jgi:DNA-binding NarL/FixJ family response regulator
MRSEQDIRVLLVEDSELLADRLVELVLSTPGAKAIGVVTTERDAIAASLSQRPDLIILDLHLKQGTGFGVLKALAHSKPRPYVIVLTNYALPQYRETALSLGAQHFLDKSSEFDRLPELIQSIDPRTAVTPE